MASYIDCIFRVFTSILLISVLILLYLIFNFDVSYKRNSNEHFYPVSVIFNEIPNINGHEPNYIPLVYVFDVQYHTNNNKSSLCRRVPVYKQSNINKTVYLYDRLSPCLPTQLHSYEFNFENGTFSGDNLPYLNDTDIDDNGIVVKSKGFIVVEWPFKFPTTSSQDSSTTTDSICASVHGFWPYMIMPRSKIVTPENVHRLSNLDRHINSINSASVERVNFLGLYQSEFAPSMFGSCETGSLVIKSCEYDLDGSLKVYTGGGRCVELDKLSKRCLNEHKTIHDLNYTVGGGNGDETDNALCRTRQTTIDVRDGSIPNKYVNCTCDSKTLPLHAAKINRCTDDKPYFNSTLGKCVSSIFNACKNVPNGNVALDYSDETSSTYVSCTMGVPKFVNCVELDSKLLESRDGCVDSECLKFEKYSAKTCVEEENNGEQYFLRKYCKHARVCRNGIFTETKVGRSTTYSEKVFKFLPSSNFKRSTSQTKFDKEILKFVESSDTELARFEILYTLPSQLIDPNNMHTTINISSFRDIPEHMLTGDLIRVQTPRTYIGGSRGFLYFSLYISISQSKANGKMSLFVDENGKAPPKILTKFELNAVYKILTKSRKNLFASSWLEKNILYVFDIEVEDFVPVTYQIAKSFPKVGVLARALIDDTIHVLVYNEDKTDPIYNRKRLDIEMKEDNYNRLPEDSYSIVVYTRGSSFLQNPKYPYDIFGYAIDDYFINKHVVQKGVEPIDENCFVSNFGQVVGTYYRVIDAKGGTVMCDDKGKIVTSNFPCVNTLYGSYHKNSLTCSKVKSPPVWWDPEENGFKVPANLPVSMSAMVRGPNAVKVTQRTVVTPDEYLAYYDTFKDAEVLKGHP